MPLPVWVYRAELIADDQQSGKSIHIEIRRKRNWAARVPSFKVKVIGTDTDCSGMTSY